MPKQVTIPEGWRTLRTGTIVKPGDRYYNAGCWFNVDDFCLGEKCKVNIGGCHTTVHIRKVANAKS